MMEMNYIVFDLEWNQSPEGKERSDRYLQFEIVEIGAVKLDQNRKPIGEFRRLVKPQVYTGSNGAGDGAASERRAAF
jgi:DNA polymerase III epsilon subunit-like protein